VSGRTHSGEARMMSRHGFDLARKRELDLGIVELLGGGATAFVGSHLFHLDDLDRSSSSPVPSAHVTVALRHPSGGSQVTVFTVHVVGTGARVVSQPDSKVLDGGGPLLVDLLAMDYLADGLLDLLQTIQIVPKPRFGHDAIGGEDAHPVKRGDPQLLTGDLPSHNAVLD